MDKKNSEDNDENCDSQFNDNETEEDGPSGEISKGKPKLSFGMSRILDDSDNDDCDDSDAEINVQDDEEVNKKPAKKSAKSNSETKFYNTIPHPYPPGLATTFGLCGISPQLGVPVHRPHPILPMLTSYSLPGWIDLRRDRFGGKDIFKKKYFYAMEMYRSNKIIYLFKKY